jgi:phosphomannomutase
MTEIKFGTSGWRGILAEDFTFPNARLVCQAIAGFLQQEGLAPQGVVIGYDTRFRSEAFAATAAEVMAGNNIVSHLTTRDCPTPVVSFAIRDGKRAGGINITASHNPAEYNGLKFSPATGGPAPSTSPGHRGHGKQPRRGQTMPLEPPGKRLIVDLEPRGLF